MPHLIDPHAIVEGEPTWGIARLFPHQGHWSVERYLSLDTNQRVEYSRGRLIFHTDMPTQAHQFILLFLLRLLDDHVRARKLGHVLPAGIRVMLDEFEYREPAIAFMRTEHANRRLGRYWVGADLVVEIVSPHPEDRKRHLETKPIDCAQAGIPEYWIVDPVDRTLSVLQLDPEWHEYATRHISRDGEMATLPSLPGLQIPVRKPSTKVTSSGCLVA